MQRTKWTERKFTFDFPEGWMFNILERLEGTSARLTAMTATLPEELSVIKPGGKWSIREHIGHLSDLEELHEGRIDDFVARKEILMAADMGNAKTISARHNARSLEELIHDFSEKRKKLVSRFRNIDDEIQYFRSIHPRLQVAMRPVDVAYFTGEHDDHHLASIREIITNQTSFDEY